MLFFIKQAAYRKKTVFSSHDERFEKINLNQTNICSIFIKDEYTKTAYVYH